MFEGNRCGVIEGPYFQDLFGAAQCYSTQTLAWLGNRGRWDRRETRFFSLRAAGSESC